MDNLVVYILVTLLSGAIGAGIGTYLGSHFSAQKQERRNKEIRNIAIKALNIIKKYSGKGNTYDMAEADFNTSLSVAEKRIFMVSLHKLGIPILATSETKFDIQHICFEKIVIDKDEILAIIKQVESGYCDKLFYIDPDTYFTDNIRLSTLRSVSKRWVKEVFAKSKLDLNTRMINYPNKWFESFTWAEKLGTAVFRERIAIEDYYTNEGNIKEGATKEICTDIDRGLWDSCFFWDIENYHSVTATSSLNTAIIKLLSNQNGLTTTLQQDKKNGIAN